MSQGPGRPEDTVKLTGLTGAEAALRLQRYGANNIPEKHRSAVLGLLGKFWAPVPWMLEATITLQWLLGRQKEAFIIGLLLVFNAVLSYLQESQSGKALALLRKRLSVQTRVLRDGLWQVLRAEELVPGDAVHLRMGDIAPADIRVSEGETLLDQSALTGESLPAETGPGATVYAGAIVVRGECTGEVTATGTGTYFGKTAELVRTAKTAGHLQRIIFGIVKYLVILDAACIAVLLGYTLLVGLPLAEAIPFTLILLVASVPVALPATFTVATAIGALELAKSGVLITRLSAIEEAAGMDVLCSDKTGTITENRLELTAMVPWGAFGEDELLRLAAMASDEAGQDPLDIAILAAARDRSLSFSGWRRSEFVPFDPRTKRSESLGEMDGKSLRVVKGAPGTIVSLAAGTPDVAAGVEALAKKGCRVLAVAAGAGSELNLAGLVGLADRVRQDSSALIGKLKDLGIRVVMVTGDAPETARAVATQVGIGSRVCAPAELRESGDSEGAVNCDVFAGVVPEDKFRLIQALQRAGHVTGMTGDGVNDAPALKQAEVGIAVSNATDVAKAAASMVLTNPGLADVVAAVETSRRIYQRMLTYTLNKIIKTIEIAVFLSVGVILTGTFVITPLLIVLLLFTNDFVTMSIATDRVSFSREPDHWNMPKLMLTGAGLAATILIQAFCVFFAARDWLHFPLPQLQTIVFVMLVFSGQGTIYLVRERRHFWRSRPSNWLMLTSIADVCVVGVLATRGVFMAAIPPAAAFVLLVIVAVYLAGLDFLKIRIFQRLGIR